MAIDGISRHNIQGLIFIRFIILSILLESAYLFAKSAPQDAPNRIVSMSLASDEILMDLLPMCGGLARLVALSKLVDDPKSSNVTDRARIIGGRVHSDIENIVKYKPELVIAASFNRQEVIEALKKRSIRTLTLTQFSTIEDIADNILKIGIYTDCESSAKKLREALLTRVNAISRKTKSQRQKPAVINYSADLVIMAKNTLFNDIVSKAGALNAATSLGLGAWPKVDAETLLKMNPDYIVIFDDENSSVKQSIKSHHIWKRLKAVQNDNFIFLKSRDAFSTSHFVAGAVETLADALASSASKTKN